MHAFASKQRLTSFNSCKNVSCVHTRSAGHLLISLDESARARTAAAPPIASALLQLQGAMILFIPCEKGNE